MMTTSPAYPRLAPAARGHFWSKASRCLVSRSSSSFCRAIRSALRSSSPPPDMAAACSISWRILSRTILMRSSISASESELPLLIVVSSRLRPEHVPFRWNRNVLSIHALAHILIGEPVSTSPGYALMFLDTRARYHLGPFLRVGAQSRIHLGRRIRLGLDAKLQQAPLHAGIRQRLMHRLVERRDDLRRRPGPNI